MQLEKNKETLLGKVTSTISSFFFGGTAEEEQPTIQVTKLVHDRQLAVLSHLPKWEGFLADGDSEEISPDDALTRVEQVFMCAARPRIMTSNHGNDLWVPEGFDWKQVSFFYQLFRN